MEGSRKSARPRKVPDSELSAEDKLETTLYCQICHYSTYKGPKHLCVNELREHEDKCPGLLEDEEEEVSGEQIRGGDEGKSGVERDEFGEGETHEETHVLSAYEKLRAGNIDRNKGFLASLGLVSSEGREVQPRETTAKRKVAVDKVEQVIRKSSRLLEVCIKPNAADYSSVTALGRTKLTCNTCRWGTYWEQSLQKAEDSMAKHQQENVTCAAVSKGEVQLSASSIRSRKTRGKQRQNRVDVAIKGKHQIWICDTVGCTYSEPLANKRAIFAHQGIHHKSMGRVVEASVCWEDDQCGGDEPFAARLREHTIDPLKDDSQQMVARGEYFDNLLSSSEGACEGECDGGSEGVSEEEYKIPKTLTFESVSQHVYIHQQMIEKLLTNPLDDIRGGKDAAANLELYTLGLNLGVSRREGQLLLDYTNKWVTLDDGLMFRTWRGLQTAICRKIQRQCDVHLVNIPLPGQFFGDKDFLGNNLKPVKCWFYPILERIGHACLAINPKDLCKTFDQQLIQSSMDRIYSTFPTGKLFERFSMHTNKVYGTGVVNIVVGVFFDEANATGSRSANPLIAWLLNVIGDSFRPIFLGYCPLSLPYSDAFLRKLLLSKVMPAAKKKQNGGLTKKLCSDIIRFAKRSALQQFLKFVLTPLLVADPIRLKIGMRKGGKECCCEEIIAKFYFGNCMGDSKALHDTGSVKLTGNCPCRWCTCQDVAACGTNAHAFVERDSMFMHNLCAELGSHTLDDFERACGTKKSKRTPVEAHRKQQVIKLGKDFSAIPGLNCMILFLLGYEKNKLWKFYRSLSIDFLHTLWKGLLEYALAWCLQVVHYFSNFSLLLTGSTKYRNGMALLDQRIAAWCGTKESLQPCRFVQLQSLSSLLKSESINGKMKLTSTSIITGSIPAWQLPGICLQMMLCLGTAGFIIPNTDIQLNVASESRQKLSANPTNICIGALASVLEVHYICESNVLSDTQLQKLAICIDNAHTSLDLLYNLRNKSAKQCRPVYVGKAVPHFEKPKVVKTHMMSHIPEQIRQLGADSRAFNASLGEKFHHETVNLAFHSSSGRFATTEKEMCKKIIERELCMQMAGLQVIGVAGEQEMCELLAEDAGDVGDLEDSDGSDGENSEYSEDNVEIVQYVDFQVIPNLGSEELVTTGTDAFLGSTKRNSTMNYLHPMCTTVELWQNIVRARKASCDTDLEEKDLILEDWYNLFVVDQKKPLNMRKARLRLAGGVRCLGDPSIGYAPCIFRANNRYKTQGSKACRPVFNSVEIEYSSDSYEEEALERTFFGKIMALVVIGVRESLKGPWNDSIYFLVARYQRLSKTSKSVMPFNEYRLETNSSRTGGLGLDFLSHKSIKKPCFMPVVSDPLPDLPKSIDSFSINSQQEISRENFDKIRWFCLPFDRCVHHGESSSWTSFINKVDSSAFRDIGEIDAEMAKMDLKASSCIIEGRVALSMSCAIQVQDEFSDKGDEEEDLVENDDEDHPAEGVGDEGDEECDEGDDGGDEGDEDEDDDGGGGKGVGEEGDEGDDGGDECDEDEDDDEGGDTD